MFRLQNNVPDVYVNESRDFQLFCRLFDICFDGVRGDIASSLNLLTAQKVKNNFLPLLANRVGFFTDKHIDDQVLRYIIASFPYAVKNKGTKLGIIQACTAVIKSQNTNAVVDVRFDKENSIINIDTTTDNYDKTALREYLRYILPAGFYPVFNVVIYAINSGENQQSVEIDSDITLFEGPDRAFATIRDAMADNNDAFAEYQIDNIYQDDVSNTYKQGVNKAVSRVDTSYIVAEESLSEPDPSTNPKIKLDEQQDG